MLTLISPAKSLNFDDPAPNPLSANRFPDETGKLSKALANFSKAKLKKIMPVSDNLVALNHDRYQNFDQQPEKPAIYAYTGDVYIGFEVNTLEDDALHFAQSHLRILSGLYGLLRPMDPIRPHRLEMGTKWAPRYKKLTDFWKDKVARALAHDLDDHNNRLVINLASNEYWAVVKPHIGKLNANIVDVDFRQDGPDGPRFISFAAKRARGMMARYICENHITEQEALKSFDSDGYRYDPDSSTAQMMRFIRS